MHIPLHVIESKGERPQTAGSIRRRRRNTFVKMFVTFHIEMVEIEMVGFFGHEYHSNGEFGVTY